MKFKVLTPVTFDKRYEPGQTIDLDAEHAEPLLEVGAIEKLPASEKVEKSAAK